MRPSPARLAVLPQVRKRTRQQRTLSHIGVSRGTRVRDAKVGLVLVPCDLLLFSSSARPLHFLGFYIGNLCDMASSNYGQDGDFMLVFYSLTAFFALGIWTVVQRYQTIKNRAVPFNLAIPDVSCL